MNELYQVKRSTRAKRLALRLDPISQVFTLVVPMRCPLEKAYDFADQYEEWMIARLGKLPPPVFLIHGVVLPLNGLSVMVNIIKDSSLRSTQINLEHNDLFVRTNKDNPAPRIMRWLKKYSLEILKVKSEEKAGYISKKIKKISVRDTKSRWGSCSADGTLSYSWRLLFAPPEALDYVVAHEVAHLKHLNHGKAFWALCRELSDDFIEGQYWMRHNGQELMRYGKDI